MVSLTGWPPGLTGSNPMRLLPTPTDLCPQLEQATQATTTRKPLAPPVRAGRVAYLRRDKRDPMIKLTPDASLTTFKRLSSYLLALAKRALADLAREGYEIPTEEHLAEQLATFAWTQHQSLVLHEQAPGEPKNAGPYKWARMTEEDFDGAALKASRRALASYSWRPGALRDRQSAGGSKTIADGAHKGPTPTKATPENAAMAQALRDIGKSQREIAAELGMSVGMVNKILRVSRNKAI